MPATPEKPDAENDLPELPKDARRDVFVGPRKGLSWDVGRNTYVPVRPALAPPVMPRPVSDSIPKPRPQQPGERWDSGLMRWV